MKNNRKQAMNKLLSTRESDIKAIFGGETAPMASDVVLRLKGLKGVKMFYYTLFFVIQLCEKHDDKNGSDIYRALFDNAMSMWGQNAISSGRLQEQALQILEQEIKIDG